MINRIYNNYRQYGAFIFLLRVIKRLFSKVIFYETYILACNCKFSGEITTKPSIKCTVVQLNEKDVAGLNIDKDKKILFHKRLNDPDNECIVAKVNNNIAYFGWINFGSVIIKPAKICIPLNPDEGFLFDAYCFPEYRGNGLHKFITMHRLKRLYESNRKKAWVSFLADNRIAGNIMKSLGFSGVHKIRVIKIGSKDIYIKHRLTI